MAFSNIMAGFNRRAGLCDAFGNLHRQLDERDLVQQAVGQCPHAACRAIHGTNEVRRLGKPASHGCVRLSPQNAATLYALVAEKGLEKTQVVLVGLTPGGEGKVTSAVRSRPRYRAELDIRPQPQRRGGLFKRLFGRR
jgi:hypothetical protein